MTPDRATRLAGSVWERVVRVEEVPDGRPVGRLLGHSGQDRDRVCVVRLPDATYLAVLDRCPHRDIAVSGGTLRDGTTLVCPGHFWCFDLPSGTRTDDPAQRLTTYPTRVRDGWVEAQVPAPAPRRSMREWLLEQATAKEAP